MRFSAAMVVFAFPLVAAHAATFTVTNLGDHGAGSLRQAVIDANTLGGANTINFTVSGTIVLTTGPIQIKGPLSIVGPGAGSLTVDGNATTGIFLIFESASVPACPTLTGPSDFLVSISGLTLKNGILRIANSAGGAILSFKSLALDSVIIRDSTAKFGGGVAFLVQYPGQSLTIANSQFINNVAMPTVAGDIDGSFGGALLATDHCNGARIAATMTIDGSVFSGNQVKPPGNVDGSGGAIALDFSGPVVIQDSRIVDNHADSTPLGADFGYNSGGIGGYARSLTIRRSEVSQNSADYVGGVGAFNQDVNLQGAGSAMQLTIVDSTVSGNVVNQTVGAILALGNVAATVANSTVAANAANWLNQDPNNPSASGIVLYTDVTIPPSGSNATPPTLQLVSSIVADGQSASPDLAALHVPLPFSVSASNSLVQSLDPNVLLSGSGNLVGIAPQLGPLANNGGPTRTQALLAGSPAINAGSNPMNLTTDQRGAGFRRTNGTATDIGAFEFVPALVYKPLEPCRIMDTRSATLASGVQGPIAGNSLKTLPGFVTAGQNWGQYGGSAASDCGLTSPPGASINAVALVATILNPNFDAYLGISDVNDLSTVLSNVALELHRERRGCRRCTSCRRLRRTTSTSRCRRDCRRN